MSPTSPVGVRITWICTALLWTLVCSTVFGYAGASWWLFELFSHFRVQYFLLGVTLFPTLWLLRRRYAGLIALAASFANVPALAPEFDHPMPPVAVSSGPAIQVLSFNLFGYNRQYDRMVQYVRGQSPDVLVLIEVTAAWLPAIEALATDYEFKWINPGDHVTGLAVLSRHTPIRNQVIDLAGNGVSSLQFTLQDGDAELTVLATHLSWPFGARRAGIRNAQLTALARLAREDRGPFVVIGDLNITPFSPYFRRALRDGNLQSCAGDGVHPTWPALFAPLFIQIDHCLASPDVDASEFRVGDFLGSDHYPIVVKVAPRQAPAADRGTPLPSEIPPVSTNRIASSTPMSSGTSRSRGK